MCFYQYYVYEIWVFDFYEENFNVFDGKLLIIVQFLKILYKFDFRKLTNFMSQGKTEVISTYFEND